MSASEVALERGRRLYFSYAWAGRSSQSTIQGRPHPPKALGKLLPRKATLREHKKQEEPRGAMLALILYLYFYWGFARQVLCSPTRSHAEGAFGFPCPWSLFFSC